MALEDIMSIITTFLIAFIVLYTAAFIIARERASLLNAFSDEPNYDKYQELMENYQFARYMDIGLASGFFVLMIVSVFLAFIVRVNPIYLIVAVLIYIINFIIVAYGINSLFELLIGGFAEATGYTVESTFPYTFWVSQHLISIYIVWTVLMMVAMFTNFAGEASLG